MANELAEEDPEGPAADARICTRSDVAAQYARHHEGLDRVAKRYFSGKHDDLAENAVMNVFLRLSKQADAGKLRDKGEDWGPYLRRAVRNSCTDVARKEVKNRDLREPSTDADRSTDVDPLGDAVVTDLQERRHLTKLKPALAKLDEKELLIIKFKFWDEWTNKQIGEAVGTSRQAVGERLKTILKKLRKEVTEDG
jgi:RNA polymerase sigma factor (sigma-70 family)